MTNAIRCGGIVAVACAALVVLVASPAGGAGAADPQADWQALLAAREQLVAALDKRAAGAARSEYRLLLPNGADRDELELTLRRRGETWGECFAESPAWCQGTMMEWRAFHLANRTGCMWRSTLRFPADCSRLAAGEKLVGTADVALRIDKTIDEKLPPGEPFGWWDRFIPFGYTQARKQTYRLDAAVRADLRLLEMVLDGGINWTGKARDGSSQTTRRPILVRLLVPPDRFAPVTVRTPTWCGGSHEGDANGLKFAGGRLTGTLIVYLHQDGWMPFGAKAPQHEPVDVKFELDARLVHNLLSGTYTGHMGGTYRGMAYRGPATETVIPPTTWNGHVRGRGGKAVTGRFQADGGIGTRTGEVCGMLLDEPAPPRELLPAAGEQTPAHVNALLHQIRAAHLALQRDIDLADALRQTAVAEPAWDAGAGAASLYAPYCRKARQLVEAAAAPSAVKLPELLAANPADSPSLGTVAAAADAAGVHTLGDGGWCFLPAWHVLGPFGQRLGLEHDDAAVAEVAPLWLDGSAPALSYRQPEDRCGVPAASLDEAAPVRWQDANCLTPRLMPPWERPGFFVRFAGQVWYAAARVRCDKPREIALALETSDHAKLWINGRLVWSDVEKPWRYRSRGHALVPAKLAAGVNELLLRVHKDRRQSWVRVALKAGAYSPPPATGAQSPQRPPVASGGAEASASPRAPDRFVYPDAAPPLAWDIDKGINVAWRRDDLAGSSRPLPAGDALFVAAAPDVLLCLDAATGKTRWSAEANVLELRDAKAMEAWKTADEAGRVKLLADLGLRIRKMDELPTSEPLSDGRRVWLHTPAGAVACFGIDGKRQWMVDAQLSRAELHLYRDTLVVEGRVASGWPLPEELMPKGKRAAAPNVSGVLLLDAATGAVRTRFTIPDAFERDAGRMIVRGSGADEAAVLLTSTSRLVDLRARRLLGMLDVEFPGPDDTSYHKGVQIIGSKPGRPFGVAVSGDVLCMTSQEQSMAVRFRPAGGGRLAYDQLWESNYGHSGFGSFQATSVATGRHLFSWMPVLDRGPHCPDPRVELHVQDLQTGRVRRILKPALRGAVNHQVMPAVAGGYVFCTDFGGGGFGGLSGHGQMLVAAADEHIRPVCRNLVDLGTRAAPAFAGARMFLRSPKALTCIAVTGPEGVLYQRRKVASALLDEIGPALTTPAPLEPQPVDPNVLGPHAPVGELLDGRATEHWLSAGPMAACADEAALASLRPRAGEEFTGGGEKKTFAPVGRKFAYTEPPIYRRQANLQGTGDIVPFFYTYVDPNCCASPKSFGLLYAVLDNPRDRYVTCMMSAPGLTVWLGGLKLALGGDAPQLIHLRPGLYPLLIRVGPAYYNPPAADMPPLPGLEVERRDLRLKPAFKEIPHPPTQRANRLDRIRRLSAELKAVVSEVPGTPEAASAKAMLEEIKGG